MLKLTDNITRKHLKNWGWTDYLIKEICQKLQFSNMDGLKSFRVSDIKESILEKIDSPRITDATQKRLLFVLDKIEGNDNLIEADFLGKLSFEERISFLRSQREKLRTEGDEILKDVKKLLRKTEKIIN
ncbi:hypothetical protein H6F39_11835 [Anabaena sp. FACHB-1250]|uniref:hypothetical protein n=1 Tax=Anabaena sp. FACHB-1250 TaxID=2692770 RepID=UPI001680C7FF|nr:hypothetical protein [Anabaena sp. FACHB-1250]MBD2142031.1 hypothetical protein [Anabaena sp. FACHB-1250]